MGDEADIEHPIEKLKREQALDEWLAGKVKDQVDPTFGLTLEEAIEMVKQRVDRALQITVDSWKTGKR